MRRQRGATRWRVVVVLGVLGLLWLVTGGSVTCQGGPSPSFQVQVGGRLLASPSPTVSR